MHITLKTTRCSKCATLSVIVHRAKHYQNIVVTSHLNTWFVPHNLQEAIMEVSYNHGMWKRVF